MTVKELIEALKDMPLDAEVVVLPNSNWFQNIDHLWYEYEQDEVIIHTKHKD